MAEDGQIGLWERVHWKSWNSGVLGWK